MLWGLGENFQEVMPWFDTDHGWAAFFHGEGDIYDTWFPDWTGRARNSWTNNQTSFLANVYRSAGHLEFAFGPKVARP